MKRIIPPFLVLCVLMVFASIYLSHMSTQSNSSDSAAIAPTDVAFAESNITVDKEHKTITSKFGSAAGLWQNDAGEILHRSIFIYKDYAMIIRYDLPASAEEIDVYHRYFPASAQVAKS